MVWYFFCTVPPPPKLGFAASPLWPPPPLPLDFNMANSPMQPLHCAHQCVFRRSGFHNSLWETTRPFQCRTASRFCSLPTVVQINKHITSQSATGTTAQALLEAPQSCVCAQAAVRRRTDRVLCAHPHPRTGTHPPACSPTHRHAKSAGHCGPHRSQAALHLHHFQSSLDGPRHAAPLHPLPIAKRASLRRLVTPVVP
jgi:hypothetical protein